MKFFILAYFLLAGFLGTLEISTVSAEPEPNFLGGGLGGGGAGGLLTVVEQLISGNQLGVPLPLGVVPLPLARNPLGAVPLPLAGNALGALPLAGNAVTGIPSTSVSGIDGDTNISGIGNKYSNNVDVDVDVVDI